MKVSRHNLPLIEIFHLILSHLEIRAHISRFWAGWPGLWHEALKVYSYDKREIAVNCKYQMPLSNGEHLAEYSVATFVLAEEKGKLVINNYTLYLVSPYQMSFRFGTI